MSYDCPKACLCLCKPPREAAAACELVWGMSPREAPPQFFAGALSDSVDKPQRGRAVLSWPHPVAVCGSIV